jgi:putative aldouronate transport system permease protein
MGKNLTKVQQANKFFRIFNINNNVVRQISSFLNYFKNHWQLYLLILPPVLYITIFSYIPMYGVQIAFKDFNAIAGIHGSAWVGLKHFVNFINTYNFLVILRNTLGISVYSLLAGFPIPIILALALNEVRNQRFKKIVQMITYAPHFISTVVMVSIIIQFLSPSVGVINHIIAYLGLKRINFMAVPEYFKSLYVWSGIWQNMGYGSIIYLSALSGVSKELHEAAIIDGASRFKRILNIDIPHLIPTIIILLILNLGRLMSVGFEKIFLMQNPLNLRTSEIISTYVYKIGIEHADFSFGAAVGFFNSVCNFILLIIANKIANIVGETSLW